MDTQLALKSHVNNDIVKFSDITNEYSTFNAYDIIIGMDVRRSDIHCIKINLSNYIKDYPSSSYFTELDPEITRCVDAINRKYVIPETIEENYKIASDVAISVFRELIMSDMAVHV